MIEQEGKSLLKKNSVGFERIKNFTEGIIGHPLVRLLWFHLNYLPISGLFLGIGSKINGSYEGIRYIRARVILNTLGFIGLRALKEHYWPDLDIERMRELVGPVKKSRRFSEALKTFSEPTPFQGIDRLKLLRSGAAEKNLLGSGANNLSIIPISSKEERKAIQRRVDGWKKVNEIFLSPKNREQYSSGKEKTEITAALNKEIDGFYGRRINPHLSFNELNYFLWILELTFSLEKAPDQLLKLVDTFAGSIKNLIDFLSSQQKDPIYKGDFNEKEVSSRIVEMAWGLMHLSHRVDLPGISFSAAKQIEQIKEMFISGKKIPKAGERAVKIFSLDSEFPPVSQNWLKKELLGGYYEDIYKLKSNIGEREVILEFPDGIEFPIRWKIFKWITLRFPFSDEVQIIQNDITFVINTLKIKEWMISDNKLIPPIKDFYSFKGKTTPPAKRYLLAA